MHADNQNISFLPAIVSTSTRMHGEFLRLLFLQAHRETEAHFIAAGMSSPTNNSEALRFKRAAFYNCLKSKVGLAAEIFTCLRPGASKKKVNQTTKPKGSRNQFVSAS